MMPAGEQPCNAPGPGQRIDYSAAPDRAPLRWPGGARVALWVAPDIAHDAYLPEKIRVMDDALAELQAPISAATATK